MLRLRNAKVKRLLRFFFFVEAKVDTGRADVVGSISASDHGGFFSTLTSYIPVSREMSHLIRRKKHREVTE